MYTAIRRFRFASDSIDQVLRIVREGFVPIIKQAPGFQGFYAVDTGNGVLVSISFFDTEEQANASTTLATSYVQQNMAQYLVEGPEVMEGQARVAVRPGDEPDFESMT